MKYIISESRLDNVVDTYLASKFEPREIVEIKVPGIIKEKKYWVVDDIVVAELEQNSFWFSTNIFNGLQGYFLLSEADILKYIKRYLLEHYNLKFFYINNKSSDTWQYWYNRYGKN